jgi:hypothetical protein
MAKELSELQKNILRLADRNRGAGKEGVTNREVLIEVYNFPAHASEPGDITGNPQIFNRQEIGINRYKSASVSVARAFNRLASRGLAIRKHNHGIILTEEGVKVTESLII